MRPCVSHQSKHKGPAPGWEDTLTAERVYWVKGELLDLAQAKETAIPVFP